MSRESSVAADAVTEHMASPGRLQWAAAFPLSGFPLPRSCVISCSWGGRRRATPQGVRGTGRGQGALEEHGVPAATQTALWGARSLLALGMYRSY